MPTKAPDLIYTMQFKIASPRYLGYTERQEAVNLSQEEELQNDSNTQHDPDEQIARYLGYTDRSAATVLEDDVHNRFPTFNSESLNLTDGQHDQLIRQLKKAQKNKALMWVGVISFDPDFINHANLRDPKTGKVNQHKLKHAIQKAMPDLLKEEGIDNPHTHWWGDIHLNTQHVHVHLTIFQDKNTRPLKNGEPKGKFSVKSFSHFKGNLHRELQNELDRSEDLQLEKDVDIIKKNLVQQFKQQLASQQQIILLQQLYHELPDYKNKKRWRASNNAYDFRAAKQKCSQLVDKLLAEDLSKTYKQLVHKWESQDTNNRQKYGQHIVNTVARKEKLLRNYLMNRVFDHCREVVKYTELKKTQPVTLQDKLASLGVQGNEKKLQQESQQLKKLQPGSLEYKKLKQTMGIRRWWLHREKLHQQLKILRTDLTQLQAIPKNQQDNVWQFWNKVTQEKIKYHELAMLPTKVRKQRSQNELYQKLRTKYGTPFYKDKKAVVRNKKQKQLELQMMQDTFANPATQIICQNHEMDQESVTKQLNYLNHHDQFKRQQKHSLNLMHDYYLISSVAQRILNSLRHSNAKDIRALDQYLDQSDDIDREDQMEELEDELGHNFER